MHVWVWTKAHLAAAGAAALRVVAAACVHQQRERLLQLLVALLPLLLCEPLPHLVAPGKVRGGLQQQE